MPTQVYLFQSLDDIQTPSALHLLGNYLIEFHLQRLYDFTSSVRSLYSAILCASVFYVILQSDSQ